MSSSASQEKKPIPKFASFKPPPPPAPSPAADRPSERSSRDADERRDKSTHHSRHRDRRERSRSRERRRERREHRDRRHHHHARDTDRRERDVAPEAPAPSPAVKQPEEDLSDSYVLDRKGDRFNLIYGTLHRYSVPLYHRVGRGSILGLPPHYKIDRDYVDDGTLVVRANTWRSDGSRSRTKGILSGLSKQRPKLLRIRQTSLVDSADDASKDYLPLDVSGSRKRRKILGDSGSDDEKYAYRSIHGKAKAEEEVPSDLEAVSDTSDEDGRNDPDEEIKQRNVEFSRMVEQKPADVSAWLQLIDHQESVLRGSENVSKSLTYAERKSLADIKLSLFEKALKRAGQSPSRDLLLLGRLEEGAKLWDTKKLASQWQEVLKANSHFIRLWIKYLDFRQTEFLGFTYERCLSTFVECLRLNKAAPEHPEKAQIQIYLFLRLTFFIRESGFAEHAAALWQAVLEITFLRPETLASSSEQEVFSAFSEFWESEVARIGDVGSKGWKSEATAEVPARVFTSQCRLNPKSIFSSWTSCEQERTREARLPARSLDESDDDDPYRVIIPSDLEEIVSLVWDLKSSHALIDGFLLFCRLPPNTSSDNLETTSRWAGDSFLRSDFVGSPDSALHDWIPSPQTSPENRSLSPFSFPQQNYIHAENTLFGDPTKWFCSLQPWTNFGLKLRSDIDPDWSRRSIRLLVEANPQNEDLAVYSVALEVACDLKEAKKYAKSLLKKRSSSLRLYNAYALIECRLGNTAAADHVWATALSMSQTFSDSGRLDSVLLWRAWILDALEARNIAKASYLLTCMPQNSVKVDDLPESSDRSAFSTTSLLKVRNYLSDTQEYLVANRRSTAFVACVECTVIFAYLSHSQDLAKSLEGYRKALTRLEALPSQDRVFKTFTTELLHQSRARILYYHVCTSKMYKPSDIRALLAESISAFPHNTMFLSLFAWNESRFRIDERVRDVVRDITETKNRSDDDILSSTQVPVTTHLYAIYTELIRPEYAGSTAHSVRAAFEKAIGDQDTSPSHRQNLVSTARANLSLWKLYVLFELSRGSIQRAKDVFYRGMRTCPWSKELVMLAFTHLRADIIGVQHPGLQEDGMDFDELRRVYNVLVEKELRIHVDIETQLDEMAAKQRTAAMGIPFSMPDDAESGDEMQG